MLLVFWIYFPRVLRVFFVILRALDIHCGRPLMMTVIQNQSKELDEMLTGERKPRIDLFRTCIAAVPRLTPDNMTGHELVDMLSRLTIHMDEELRGLAHQSLQTLVYDFPEWRQDVIQGFSQFLARDVVDTFPQLLDNGLRMLYAFLTVWRNSLGTAGSNGSSNSNTLNNKLATTTTVAAGGVVQHPIGGIVSRGPQAGESSKLTQTQVNASLNTGTATINSNSSGSSGISSITQTTTVTHAGAGVGAGSAAIGGTGSSGSSSIPGSGATSVGGVGGGAGDAPSSGSGRKGHEAIPMDEDVGGLGLGSLYAVLLAFAAWRLGVLHGFGGFLVGDVVGAFGQLLAPGLCLLSVFLSVCGDLLGPAGGNGRCGGAAFNRYLSAVARVSAGGVVEDGIGCIVS
uniref:Putative secreted protein n=1 Tax=Anopheles triannulatus TaxID=58253 RepID=A0A2M4B277_9DIPT